MSQKINKWRESGVSETVGFIIIMGIVLTGIGLVTLYGYPALLDAQQNANIKNMERNMISLQSDVNSLTYKNVPYKETMMQVSGGTLSIENPVVDPNPPKYFTISDTAPLLPDPPIANSKFQPGAIKFLSDNGDIIISLQNGAVIKHQSPGSVMISEPRWYIDDNIFIINLIQIESDQPLAIAGMSTVQLSIEPLNIDTTDGDNIIDKSYLPGSQTITISYHDTDFDFYTAWRTYFKNTLGMTETGPNNWQLPGVERIIIKAWKVKVLNI